MKTFLKHSYLILLLVSCLIVVPTALILQSCDSEPTDDPISTTTTVTSTTAVATTTVSTTATTTTTQPTTTTSRTPAGTNTTVSFPDANDKVSFADTLFIGDSRTVGLRDYGKISDATFFCAVSLSSNNVRTKAIEVKGYGDITLGNLLGKKSFTTVYIMLGINEIGGNLTSIANKYQLIIDLVHEKQPNATVVVQSTLHVTSARNQQELAKKGYFNNPRINDLNAELAKLANGTSIRYLDMNPMYDDENKCLMAEAAASDGIHIKAKYYLLWRDYLDKHRIS